jgi:hypothetical protein
MKSFLDPSFTTSDSFRKNGFVVIPGVLDGRQVAEYRKLLLADFKTRSRRMETIGYFLKCPLLYQLQCNAKIVDTVSQIVGGEVTYVNNIEVQCNMFGLNGRKRGWHPDCGSEVSDLSNQYLYSPDYLFGKIGVYLQDNTVEFGGGIDVQVGGHHDFKALGNAHLNYAYWKIASELRHSFCGKMSVPIKAGTAVYFDSRLPHRSTPGSAVVASKEKTERLNLPEMHSKYVVYWEATNAAGAVDFLRNAKKRAAIECDSTLEAGEMLFAEYLGYVFPDDYPTNYVQLVQSDKRIRIASISPKLAKTFRAIFAESDASNQP